MEIEVQHFKQIQSPLYDRRLMILILKKTNGRRSFSENCRYTKIKDERRYRHNEPNQKTPKTQAQTETETQADDDSNKKTEISN